MFMFESKFESSHLVYKFTFSCCNAAYYGDLDTSLLEFLNIFVWHTFKWKSSLEPQKVSYLLSHFAEGYNTSFEDFTILLKESNKFKLHLQESLLIKRDKLELNRNILPTPKSFLIDCFHNLYFIIYVFTYMS